MAIKSFLHIEGVKGECQKKGYEDWIEIYAHDFKLTRKTGGMGDSHGTTGRPEFQPLSIIKRMDIASPLLIKSCLNNETFDKAELVFVKTAKGGSDFVHMKYVLNDVSVVGFQPVDNDNEEDEVIKEKVDFYFRKFELTCTADTDGLAKGDTSVQYDLTTGH